MDYLLDNYKDHISYWTRDRADAYAHEQLKTLLKYVQTHSTYYRKVFENLHINIDQVKHITELPITTKRDLQLHGDDFLCAPKNKIIDYTSTSGTLGSPVLIGLTENDLKRLAYNEYSSFLTADGSSEDIYQLMLTLDRQFMAGMAYYSGIRMLGAGVIRVGPGMPSLQWDIIDKIKPSAIVAVPSFIVKLIQYAKLHQIDYLNSSVKRAICIGEQIRNPDLTLNTLGKRITENWPIKLYSTYASTEMQTAFTECSQRNGVHHNPELVIVELLDEHNQPVPPNTVGEVTITTLGVEGMPLIRYKTGDLSILFDTPCSCGRTSVRLAPLLGRKQQMIKFKGTTIYPTAIFDVINEIDNIDDYVIILSNNDLGFDDVSILMSLIDNELHNRIKIKSLLKARLRVSPNVQFVNGSTIKDEVSKLNNRKPVKLIDRRN